MDGWRPKVDGDGSVMTKAKNAMQGKISMERRKRACRTKDERRRGMEKT
jgi:hypothetical protein